MNRIKFKVGDIVIDKNGRTGWINNVCHCDKCKERGFYEPKIQWLDNPDEYDYISIDEYDAGLINRFIRVGEFEFNKKEKSQPVITTIDRIVFEAPRDVVVQCDPTVLSEIKHKNYLLYRKYGEKCLKITGLTSDGKDFEINLKGEYEVDIKY